LRRARSGFGEQRDTWVKPLAPEGKKVNTIPTPIRASKRGGGVGKHMARGGGVGGGKRWVGRFIDAGQVQKRKVQFHWGRRPKRYWTV